MKYPKPHLNYSVIKLIPNYWIRVLTNSPFFGYKKDYFRKLNSYLKDKSLTNKENTEIYKWNIDESKKTNQ